MATLTPEERRRLAAARRAARDADLGPRPPREAPPPSGHPHARALRASLLAALGLAAALTAAWVLWPVLSELRFALPPSLLDWLLPPVPSQPFP